MAVSDDTYVKTPTEVQAIYRSLNEWTLKHAAVERENARLRGEIKKLNAQLEKVNEYTEVRVDTINGPRRLCPATGPCGVGCVGQGDGSDSNHAACD